MYWYCSTSVCQHGHATESVSAPLFTMARTDGKHNRWNTASHSTPTSGVAFCRHSAQRSSSDPLHCCCWLHLSKTKGLPIIARTVQVPSIATASTFRTKTEASDGLIPVLPPYRLRRSPGATDNVIRPRDLRQCGQVHHVHLSLRTPLMCSFHRRYQRVFYGVLLFPTVVFGKYNLEKQAT